MNTYHNNTGAPYQQGGSYQHENTRQQGAPYQQGNYYQQGAPYPDGAYNNFSSQPGGHYSENGMPQKAPNIFRQFLYSFVPSRYGSFANVGTGSMIGFVTLLTFTATLLLFIIASIRIMAFGGFEAVLDKVPDFEISHGRFSIDKEFYVAEGDTFFYFTDEIPVFTYDDVKELRTEGYKQILLISRGNLAMYQNAQYQEIEFSQLNDNITFNKLWLKNVFFPIMWICMAIGMAIFFVFRTFWYFACAAMYMLVGLIIAAISQKSISAGNLFKTAVYAKVVMFVAALVFSQIPFLPVLIPGILKITVRFIITVVFMAFAIQYVPQNRWNRRSM